MNEDFKEAFEKTKIAGTIASGALDEVSKIVKPGISTEQIDKIVMNLSMIIKLTRHLYSTEVFQSHVALQQITLCVMEYLQIKS